MERNARKLIVLAVLAMTLSTLVLAQEFAYRVEANIPFDFFAGDQHMVSGDYLFVVNCENHGVTVHNQTTGKSLVLLASPIEYASPGFDRRNSGDVVELTSVGGRYVLSDIETRTDGVSFSQGASPSATAEKEDIVRIVAAIR